MTARRGKGEGSIYRRSDGRWAGVVNIGWYGGKRTRKYIYGATRQQVAKKVAITLKAHQDGVLVSDDRTTVKQFLNGWLDNRRSHIRPSTWNRYEQLIRLHAIPVIGNVRLVGLQPQHLQRLYTNRLNAGLSPTTVLQLHRILHKALDQATKWGTVARNVAALVDSPRRASRTVQALTPQEAEQFLTTARGDRLEALYVTAIMTGMRRGELLGLHWRDVDFAKGELVVRHSLATAQEGGYELGPTKTMGSRRRLLLASPVVTALEAHRQRQEIDRANSYGTWTDHGLVFTNVIGQPLDPSNLLVRSFYPLLERARLHRIRFHDLRHTAATLLLGQGIHPKIVSEMLGHTQIGITLDLYSHVTETMLGQARDAFDDLFGCQNGCQSDDEPPPEEGDSAV